MRHYRELYKHETEQEARIQSPYFLEQVSKFSNREKINLLGVILTGADEQLMDVFANMALHQRHHNLKGMLDEENSNVVATSQLFLSRHALYATSGLVGKHLLATLLSSVVDRASKELIAYSKCKSPKSLMLKASINIKESMEDAYAGPKL